MDEKVRDGERVVLAWEDERYLLTAGGPVARIRGLGVLDPKNLVGLAWGGRLDHASKTLRVLRPSFADHARSLERKAQVVLPKDAARILFEADVHPGARVVESGAGSGALTLALARAVGETGRVTVYEIREDFASHARGNLERAGLLDRVELKLGDVTKGVSERNADAFVLDIPNPWDAVPAAREALRAEGHFAAYSPLVTQVEATTRALREAGFADVRTLEVVERPWVVGERGSRPEHAMLGHTAFLTFARKG